MSLIDFTTARLMIEQKKADAAARADFRRLRGDPDAVSRRFLRHEDETRARKAETEAAERAGRLTDAD